MTLGSGDDAAARQSELKTSGRDALGGEVAWLGRGESGMDAVAGAK
jgi:hypothetical protein